MRRDWTKRRERVEGNIRTEGNCNIEKTGSTERTGSVRRRRGAGLCLAVVLTFAAASSVFAATGAGTTAGMSRGPAAEIEQREKRIGQNADAVGESTDAVGESTDAVGQSAGAVGQSVDVVEQTANTTGQTTDAIEQNVNGSVFNGDVNTLKAAQEADSLILAVGNPEDPAKTTVSYYERAEGGALQQVFSVPAVSGMNGISTDKVEGDKKTPEGLYSFTMAFGMKEDPGSILPYHKVVAGDYFVDDGNSRYYNRLVNENEVERDWITGENLIRQAPHYNYALVLNYNDSYIPGKGSAIFLHCPKVSNNTGTSGCISVPEEYAKELVRRVDVNTKILVVPDEKSLANY